MSERPHLIQLELNEDVASVRDRLSFIRGERVLLVWPERGTALTRKLDLVLVQREAMRRAIRLAFVTYDTDVIKHADDLNISTFETIGESERKRWKRARSKVFTNRFQKPSDEPIPADLQEVASRILKDEQPEPLQLVINRAIMVMVFIVVILAMAYIILPSATVTITPAQEVVESSQEIIASPDIEDIDIENGIIPMTRLRVEATERGTVETSGELSLGDSRAVGSVVFINRSATEIVVPQGTVVTTSAGTPIQFRILNEITVPAGIGLQAEVGIEALQDFAGPIGNVDEGLINTVVGPLAGQIDVRNITPTEGGATQTTRAVSNTDHERLEAMVRQQIQAQAYTAMQPQLSASQFVILETISIAEERNDWKEFSAGVGDTADTLSLNMRAIIEAGAVDEQFGRQIAFAKLSSSVPRGRVIKPESIEYVRGQLSGTSPDGSVTFNMTVHAIVEEPINISEIQTQLAFRNPSTALSYLVNDIDLQPGTLPQIELAPAWLPRMPVLPIRINVEVIEATS